MNDLILQLASGLLWSQNCFLSNNGDSGISVSVSGDFPKIQSAFVI